MTQPSNELVERIARITAMDADLDPDMVLIMMYLTDDLSLADRQAYEGRMEDDAAFRGRAEGMRRIWSVPEPRLLSRFKAPLREMRSALDADNRATPLRIVTNDGATPFRWQRAASIAAIALVSGAGLLVMRTRGPGSGPVPEPSRVAVSPPHAESVAAPVAPRPTGSGGPATTASSPASRPTSRGDAVAASRVPAAPPLPALGPVVVAGSRSTPIPSARTAGDVRVNIDAVCDSARARLFAAGPPPSDTGAYSVTLRELLAIIFKARGRVASESPAGGTIAPTIPSEEPKERGRDIAAAARICDSLAAAAAKKP